MCPAFTVAPDERGLRLDVFLSRHMEGSRERLKKAVRAGHCAVDGSAVSAPDTRLTPGQTVELELPEKAESLSPEEGEIRVLFQDAHLVVLDKAAGLTVHPCPSCPEGTLVHRLLAHFPELARLEGLRPGIVHRLDKDTSGLIAVALTEPVRLALSEAFAARQVSKTYLALTRGVPAEQGHCDQPVGRHPTVKTRMAVVPESRGGKAALSCWKTLYADPGGRFALLAVTIHTGRTHQIRVHLSHSGYPLWGDSLYAPHRPSIPGIAVDPAPRQMLHAWKLAFTHPVTAEPLSFTCPPPADMEEIILTLAAQPRAVILTGTPGCGKSSLLRLLRERGLPVWSADEEVARLYAAGADGWRLLHDRYGGRFTPTADSGAALPVDRAALAAAFMDDPGLRAEVEALIHPLVFAGLAGFFEENRRQGRDAVAEVPLWHEKRTTKPDKLCPWVITVTCPREQRLERLAGRGWDEDKAAAVESWQWPEEAKIRSSDHVIDNSGTPAALARQADGLLENLKAEARRQKDALRRRLYSLWGGEA